jgi:hypothetical protein
MKHPSRAGSAVTPPGGIEVTSEELYARAEQRFGAFSANEAGALGVALELDVDDQASEKLGAVVRAELVRWLLVDPELRTALPNRLVRVEDAKVKGELDLRDVVAEASVELVRCTLTGRVLLAGSKLHRVVLMGGTCKEIDLGFAHVAGPLYVGRAVQDGKPAPQAITVSGSLKLHGASIDGDLTCTGAELEADLDGEGVEVKGHAFLDDGFEASGEVRLLDATIGGVLDCRGGSFTALSLERSNVGGEVRLAATKADPARRFTARGQVTLAAAKVGGDLNCDGGHISNPSGTALSLARASVTGSVLLGEGFEAQGLVELDATTVGADLDCRGGDFEAGTATPGTGQNPVSIRAKGASIGGGAWFAEASDGSGRFTSDAQVDLTGARIGGDLRFDGAQFTGRSHPGLVAERATIGGTVHWRSLTPPKGGMGGVLLDLTDARAARLEDDQASWPGTPLGKWKFGRFEAGSRVRRRKGVDPCLRIRGFEYQSIAWPQERKQSARELANWRLDWLHRHTAATFSPQPYEQLTTVLRRAGQEAAAKRVAVVKQRDRRRLGRLRGLPWLGNVVADGTIGYGYQPWRALVYGLVLCLTGALVFNYANHRHLMAPAKSISAQSGQPAPTATRFNPVVYSLDSLIPVINFHQEENWLPTGKGTSLGGKLVLGYLWAQIALGWVLTTLGALSLTNLVRKD